MIESEDPEQFYEILEYLGEGQFGTVVKARLKRQEEEQYVAIKIIPLSEQCYHQVRSKMERLIGVQGEFLLRYHGLYFKDGNMWIVMEYCETGSVSDVLRDSYEGFKDAEIATILKYCLLGLQELAQSELRCHLNLKASNLLIDQDGVVKLADWMIMSLVSYFEQSDNSILCSNPFWTAPEQLKRFDLSSPKADIW